MLNCKCTLVLYAVYIKDVSRSMYFSLFAFLKTFLFFSFFVDGTKNNLSKLVPNKCVVVNYAP